MFKNFNDFSKKDDVLFEKYNNDFSIDDMGIDVKLNNEIKLYLNEVETISDDKYLTNITLIVLKKLKNNFDINWSVNPFILKIKNNKCTMIYCKNIYIVLYKNGIEKRILCFKNDPSENIEKPEFLLSSIKLGFVKMVNTLIETLKTFYINDKGILESFEGEEEFESPIESTDDKKFVPKEKPIQRIETERLGKIDGSFSSVIKRLSGINEVNMTSFLKLYEKYEDSTIANIMIKNGAFDESNELKQVQDALFYSKSGVLEPANARKAVIIIHYILCGVIPRDVKMEEKEMIEKCWFFKLGASGKLAVSISSVDESVEVKSVPDFIEKGINELEYGLKEEKRSVESLLEYIKEGGKNGTSKKLSGNLSKKRGVLVSGYAGIGKSKSIYDAIKETGAIEDRDFHIVKSVTTTIELYKTLYEYNNMLLILDDVSRMWDTEQNIALFKFAAGETEKDRTLETPTARRSDKEYYEVDSNMTRRDRYYLEVGKITEYEKKVWIEKEMNRIRNLEREKERTIEGYMSLTPKDIEVMAKSNFDTYSEERKIKKIPTTFTFNGFLVLVTNKTLSAFERDKNVKDHFGALKRRFNMININPTRHIVWEWLKRKIYKDAENSELSDEMRLIPLQNLSNGATLENIVEFIESLVNGEHDTLDTNYGAISFTTIKEARDYTSVRGRSMETWKNKIKSNMIIKSDRRDG